MEANKSVEAMSRLYRNRFFLPHPHVLDLCGIVSFWCPLLDSGRHFGCCYDHHKRIFVHAVGSEGDSTFSCS